MKTENNSEIKVADNLFQSTHSNKYYVRIKIGGKDIKSELYAHLVEAEEELRRLKEARETTNVEAKTKPHDSLEVHSRAYLENYALGKGTKGRSEMTINGETGSIRRIARCWSEFSTLTPLTYCAVDHIPQLFQALQAAKTVQLGDDMSGATIHKDLYAMGRFIRHLSERRMVTVREHEITSTKINQLLPKVPSRPLPSDDPQLAAKMLGLIRDKYAHSKLRKDRDKLPMVALLMLQGIREGALSPLTPKDIDFVSMQISIYSDDEFDKLVIPMSAELAPFLIEHIDREEIPADQPLFELTDITGTLKLVANLLGLNNWYPHACRKYFGTMAVLSGIPIPLVAKMMGHKDNGATLLRNYVEIPAEVMAEAIAKMRMLPVNPETARALAFIHKAPLLDIPHLLQQRPGELADSITRQLLTLREALVNNSVSKLKQFAAAEKPLESADSITQYAIKPSDNVLVADRIRYLVLKAGLSPYELGQNSGLSGDTAYRVLTGVHLTSPTMDLLTRYFQVRPGYFSNAKSPVPNYALIRDNLLHLMRLYGKAAMPVAATVSKVIDNKCKPAGDLLAKVASQFGCTIEELMTVNLAERMSASTELSPQAGVVVSENLMANLQFHMLLKGVHTKDAADKIGITQDALRHYVMRRNPAPEPILKAIADFCGMEVHTLVSSSPRLSATTLGKYINTRFQLMGIKTVSAATRMALNSPALERVVNGEKLPNPEQVQRLSNFLGITPQELLSHGILPESSSKEIRKTDSATNPPAVKEFPQTTESTSPGDLAA